MRKRKGARAKMNERIEKVNSESLWLPVAGSIAEMLDCLRVVKTGLVDLGFYKSDEVAIGIEDDVMQTVDEVEQLEKSMIVLCRELDLLAKKMGRK